MIELTEKIVVGKQFLQDPQILIDGSSFDKTRRMTISIPVVNEEGQRVKVLTKEYSGAEFNEVYGLYTSDKSLLEKVLTDIEVEADISNLSDDLTN